MRYDALCPTCSVPTRVNRQSHQSSALADGPVPLAGHVAGAAALFTGTSRRRTRGHVVGVVTKPAAVSATSRGTRRTPRPFSPGKTGGGRGRSHGGHCERRDRSGQRLAGDGSGHPCGGHDGRHGHSRWGKPAADAGALAGDVMCAAAVLVGKAGRQHERAARWPARRMHLRRAQASPTAVGPG